MKLYFSLLVTTMVLTACKHEKPQPVNNTTNPPATTGTVTLNVVPKLGSAPFAYYTDYMNPLNQRIQVEVLRFFLTNIYAYNAAGDSTLLLDAFEFDWGIPRTSITFNANPGTYTGLSLGVGVDSSHNHSDPAVYDPSYPLSYAIANAMHWSWSSGYVFLKLEGKDDRSGTGTGPLNHLFSFHTGDDKCYLRTPHLPKGFSVNVGQNTTLNLNLDVTGIFTQATDTIDLSQDSLTHAITAAELNLSKRIAKNMSKSFWF